MRQVLPVLMLCILAAAPAAEVNVPAEMKRIIIDHFSQHFVVPQTAIWEYDSIGDYVLGGTLVCGKVNYQNSLRQYVGALPFYLVIKRNGRTGDGGLMPVHAGDDPTGSVQSSYDKVCHPSH